MDGMMYVMPAIIVAVLCVAMVCTLLSAMNAPKEKYSNP